MSLEEELAEMSLVYHGQRERVQELEQLAKDAMSMSRRLYNQIELFEARKPFIDSLRELEQRAKALLEGESH